MERKGLDEDGFIAREGGLDRVPEAFAPVVAAARAGIMAAAAAIGRAPAADRAVLTMLIDDLGPWLAAEYTAVHGRKAPRGATG